MAKKLLTGLTLVNLDSDPSVGSEGELYFNTSSSVARIYKSGEWSPLASNIKISQIAPESPNIGDLWYQESPGAFLLWNGNSWVKINDNYNYKVQKIIPSDFANNDEFGYSVSISEDGNTAVIGAFGKNISPNSNNGAAYVFTRLGNTWIEQQQLLPSDIDDEDNFGSSVAISSDGNNIVVCAYGESTSPNSANGAAYVFTKSGSTWIEEAKLVASDPESYDYFGEKVSISGDGNTIAIGTTNESTSPNSANGAVYVFTRSSSTWTEQEKIVASDADSNDYFSFSLDLSEDGNILIVGASYKDNGVVYIYTRSGSTWTEQQKILGYYNNYFGESVCISRDGNKIFIGAVGADNFYGAVYEFQFLNSEWTEVNKIVALDQGYPDYFGYSVDVSSDGSTLIVGASQESTSPNSVNGAAYVFTSSGSNWVQVDKLFASDKADYDYFGRSVSISGDGNIIIVGADYEDTYPNTYNGAAYIYTYPINKENVQDYASSLFIHNNHTNITATYDDINNQILLSASVSGSASGYTNEEAVDAVAAALLSGSNSNVIVTYDDAANSISLNTSGSITNIDSIVYPDYIAFDTSPENSSASIGTLFWDSGDSLPKAIIGTNLELGIGQEQVALVKNATGSSIAKGKVVYINGAAGQRPTIALSDSDAESTSSKTLGMTSQTIANGDEGFVTTFGILRGVDTSAFTAGQALWLSSTAGEVTATLAVQPQHLVFVGYAVKISSTAGEIFVNPQNGYELNELHNVLLDSSGSIADNEVLAYDTTSGLWKNQTAEESGLLSISSASSTYLTQSSASTTYQPKDTELTALAGLTSAADTLPYFTGSGTASTTTITSFGRSLIDDADASTARTTLGLGTMSTETASNYLTTATASSTYLTQSSASTTYQPKDTELTALAGLTSAADTLPYFTGSGTASTTTITSFGRSLIDDADASTARTTLGLGTMSTETASNYLTTSSASSTYLTQSGASSTYVNSVIGTTNEIEVSRSSGSVTIGLPDNLTVSNDLNVLGNLTVSGSTTTLNVENLLIEDNIITLNSNVSGSPSTNAGIEIERGNLTNVQIRWNETSDQWEYTNDGTTYSAIGSGGGAGSSVTVSDTAPSSPSTGDLWFNSSTTRIYIRYDGYWIEASSPVAAIGQLDGGTPTSTYGGIISIDAGGI